MTLFRESIVPKNFAPSLYKRPQSRRAAKVFSSFERNRPFLFTRQFKIKKHRYRDRVGKPKQPDRNEEANRPDDYRNGSTSSYFRWNISCCLPCRPRPFGFLLTQEILN